MKPRNTVPNAGVKDVNCCLSCRPPLESRTPKPNEEMSVQTLWNTFAGSGEIPQRTNMKSLTTE